MGNGSFSCSTHTHTQSVYVERNWRLARWDQMLGSGSSPWGSPIFRGVSSPASARPPEAATIARLGLSSTVYVVGGALGSWPRCALPFGLGLSWEPPATLLADLECCEGPHGPLQVGTPLPHCISSVVEVPAYCHCSRGELSGGHTRSGTGRSRRVCAASRRPRRPQGCAPQPDSQVRGSLWFRHFPREGRRIFCDPLVHSLGLFICLYCYIYIACPFL